MIDVWTAVCVFKQGELIARCMRTEEVERVHEREHFYQHDSTYPAFSNINGQQIVTPGKNWMHVTQSLTLRVLRSLFQNASLQFVSLSVHWGCHIETRYANTPYPMTETHILKDKIVN